MTPMRILEWVDEQLTPRWQAWRDAQNEFGAKKTYHAYLRSDEWRARRDLAIKRAGGICEACGVNEGNQVHHVSYEFKFREPLWDLRAVCDPCHEALTAMENHNKWRS